MVDEADEEPKQDARAGAVKSTMKKMSTIVDEHDEHEHE